MSVVVKLKVVLRVSPTLLIAVAAGVTGVLAGHLL